MRIECCASESCPSLSLLKENMERAIEEGGFEAEVSYRRISDDEAVELNLAGSPTILVNGKDIFPSGTPGFA